MAQSSGSTKRSSAQEMANAALARVRGKSSEAQQAQAEEAPKSASKESAKQFADLKNNPFYKIAFDKSLSPSEKKSQIAEALTFSEEDSKEAKTRLAEFDQFKAYLQFERKRMAQEIISLTDTEAFGELKTVFEDINAALLEFEDDMNPLLEIVDAVNKIRTSGNMYDLFREIQEDRNFEEERQKELEEQTQKADDIAAKIQAARERKAELGEEKGLFGLGGVKKSARQEIAKLEMEIGDLNGELSDVRSEVEKLSNPEARETQFEDLAEEKARLRELLDITSDDHKARQQKLVDSANNFVDTTDERVGSVLGHFDSMSGQIDRLTDANYQMRQMYAILTEATKDASGKNEEIRGKLEEALSSEEIGEIEKMETDANKRALENHITALSNSNVDTTRVMGELTRDSVQIENMRTSTDQQINKTRTLHTSGVAGVASQLSTVLQAISNAALGESSEVAGMTLDRMMQITDDVSQKDVIATALGGVAQNEKLQDAIDRLGSYGETVSAATEITRSGVEESKRLLGDMERVAAETKEKLDTARGTTADVVAGKGADGVKPAAEEQDNVDVEDDIDSPFGFPSNG